MRSPQQSQRELLAHSPLLVFYEVTQACDLVCEHCRACAQAHPHRDELSTRESLELIEQLTEFPSPPTLVLTGGDPFKRPDIFQLIEYAVGRRLSVAVTPSATPLVTRQAIERLRRAGISRLAISIDGADARTHDNRRGVSGSFQRSLEILSDAHAEGIVTQVNTTIVPANAHQIDCLAELLARQNIDMWSVFFLVPVGRASFAPRLTADECEAAFECLWFQTQRQPYAIKTTAAPHYRRFVIERLAEAKRSSHTSSRRYRHIGLNDGNGVMFISHVGKIYPSGFMPLLCGRFPAAHVVNVYQESAIFQGLRDAQRLEGKCGVCEFRHVCGGSRARAYATTGNPFAEEPDCAYVPEAFDA
jgi:radical SAM protein